MVEMRGKNMAQKCFVGIAFNGHINSNREALFCRPFNFLAIKSDSRIHVIQYEVCPFNTRNNPRFDQNAELEHSNCKSPTSDGWFKMTLHVKKNKVIASINDAINVFLQVMRLASNGNGRVGIFRGIPG